MNIFSNDEMEELYFISNCIKSKVNNVNKIILFGSTARGNSNKDSDIDILVVANDNFNKNKINKIHNTFIENINLPIKIEPLYNYGKNKNKIYHILYCNSKEFKIKNEINCNIKRDCIFI